MPLFNGVFIPKKSAAANGAVAMAICAEYKTAKLAAMGMAMLLEEAYSDSSDNFFKAKICADRVGMPRPPIGEFSTEFMEHNQWNDETKEIEPIPLPEQGLEGEGEGEGESGNDGALEPGAMKISSLQLNARVAYILMYGTAVDTVDPVHLSNAYELLSDDDAQPIDKAILDALPRIPQVGQMLITSIEKLILAIQSKTPALISWPDVKKFAEKWIADPAGREKLVGTSTSNGIPGPINYDTLDTHIALSVAAVHPNNAKATDVRNANDIKDSRDPVWRAWTKTLRVITGICDVDTDTRHSLVSEGMKNPQLLSNDDERLHFAKSRLAGHPACPELADYGKPKEEAKAEVQNLGSGMFSVEGLIGKTEEPKAATKAPDSETKTPITATEPANDKIESALPAAPAPDDLRSRADALEKELAAKTGSAAENLHIWKQVQRTDPARTKRQDTTNGKGEITRTITSIKPVYQYMRATEIFGPIGIGWGVDVVEERFDRGIPLMESIIDGAGREIGKKVMRDGDGSIITSLNHTMKITLWYLLNGKRGEVTAYGHTKALYSSKYGLTVEEEPSKKSLTDATTKALSSLGFSADVYLGLFEDAEYKQENEREHGIKNASDKAEESVRLRKELDERFATNTDTMRSAVTKNEVTQIASSLTRTIGAHIKSAKAVGDTQHAKYLESRLNRLEEIRKECLAKFDEEKTT